MINQSSLRLCGFADRLADPGGDALAHALLEGWGEGAVAAVAALKGQLPLGGYPPVCLLMPLDSPLDSVLILK